MRIAGKERAILAKYILFNQPHAMFWLGFDVDRIGAAIDWSDRNAPAPTLTITNPENGHAHLLYALETSIRTAPDGKMKPLRYAAAVENALRRKLGADTGYSGLICKNPNHSQWKIAADYDLVRNCTLFDQTRKWAYRAIRQGWPEYEQWLQ
ncbi:replication initiation protein, partial [Escherichia coli]|nr:replication initiation protein [Escherichia coli]